jgi:hypothetical protein
LKNFLTRKDSGGHQAKEEKREKLSPRDKKACQSVNIALMQSVAETETQRTMKRSKKTLHEFTSHIPPKKPKRK